MVPPKAPLLVELDEELALAPLAAFEVADVVDAPVVLLAALFDVSALVLAPPLPSSPTSEGGEPGSSAAHPPTPT